MEWVLLVLVVLRCLPQQVVARKQLSDFIWQLGDVESSRPTGNPYTGGQNMTWCCIKAIAESLYVDSNDTLMIRSDHRDWISVDSAEDLLAYTYNSQFPCTAIYVEGDYTGAPMVQTPYTWIKDVCPGWQRSDTSNLNGWLQPLAAYIVPAVIFCLSVPRRRKIAVPRALFVPDFASALSYVFCQIAAIVAGFIVLTDTIIWLGICFALAGPMIISGIYEAWLDNRILEFVKEKIRNEHLTIDMRARLLMLILAGNLDLALDEPTSMTKETRIKYQRKIGQRNNKPRESPWIDMERLLYAVREYDGNNANGQFAPPQDDGEASRIITPEIISHIDQTKTRLRTMLHCQHSFGFIVGAPVIFFLGGFVFALLQSLAVLGDEHTAHSLAFGQFYMIIPHTAIVSGLLLAGNNPNILEGVLATEADADDDIPLSFLGIRFELAYPSCYKVAWQWQRGNSKQIWIGKLIETYRTEKDKRTDRDLDQLRERTSLAPMDWILVLGFTAVLVGIPFLLALLTAYFTPEAGQVPLWLWAYAGSQHTRQPIVESRFSRLWNAIWYFLVITLGIIGVFAAVGGTLMQLLGVYSADLCNLTTNEWFMPYDQCSWSVVWFNSELMIRTARTWWLGGAITAIGFMALVSFVAWWYQRRMRDIFIRLVRQIDSHGGSSRQWKLLQGRRAEFAARTPR